MDANYRAEAVGGEKTKFEPDVKRLDALFQECLTRPMAYVSNAALNLNARYNYWPGKSWDGRRWNPREGDKEVLPWLGASDLSVPLIDGYINEDGALAVMALMNANVTVTGHNSKDIAFGTRATNVLKWLLEDLMPERVREINLLANYHFERGNGVLGVQWERQVQMGYEVLTLDMVMQMSQQAALALQQADQPVGPGGGSPSPQPSPPGEGALPGPQSTVGAASPAGGSAPQAMGAGTASANVLTAEERERLAELASVPQMLNDPTATAQLAGLVQDYATHIVATNFKAALGEYEDELLEDFSLSMKSARRVVADLRADGRAKFPVPTVRWNRPVLMALALDEDFFIPNDATDLENMRGCFWREWITESQLRERGVSAGWNQNWVEYVAVKGKGDVGANATPAGAASASHAGGAQNHGRTLLNVENLYGILHGYERRVNEDGVPGIYYTVFHPSLLSTDGKTTAAGAKVTQAYAVSLLLDYAHGDYPFTLARREFLSRRADDSRGYGEIGFTWQQQIKAEGDMQIDRSMLATIPPLHHPKGRPPTKWGPGVKIGEPPSSYAFAAIPELNPASESVAVMVQRMADGYFGRAVEGRDPALSQVLRQHMIATWLDACRLAYTQVFQLAQQYLPDEFYYRVVGSDQGQTLHASRDEIQGKFSVSLKFDAQRLDAQMMESKGNLILKLVQALDINGITDHNKTLQLLLGWVDPDVPEMILKPADAATQQEVEDEQGVCAKLWSGQGVDVKPGQAYQLRLQVLQNWLQAKDPKSGEPINPAGLQRYQMDAAFKKLVDNRVQQLQFQLEQRQNAVIGRLGAQPAAQPQTAQGPGQ